MGVGRRAAENGKTVALLHRAYIDGALFIHADAIADDEIGFFLIGRIPAVFKHEIVGITSFPYFTYRGGQRCEPDPCSYHADVVFLCQHRDAIRGRNRKGDEFFMGVGDGPLMLLRFHIQAIP